MSKPNIVLITADQLHKGALSCYGNPAIETEHIDALAGDGLQFDRSYTTSPWCLPARCSLATGLYPHNNGAFSNYKGWDGRLDTDLPNLYTALKAGGYETSHVGKCHYAPIGLLKGYQGDPVPVEKFRRYYHRLGIDHLDLQEGKHGAVWFRDDYGEELDEAGFVESYREQIYSEETKKVFEFPGPTELHPDNWVGEKATEYLRTHANRPLFLWVSFSGPHFPFDPSPEFVRQVDPEEIPDPAFDEAEFEDEGKIHYKSYHGHDSVRRIDANGVLDACKDYSEDYWSKLRRYYLANVLQIDEQVGNVVETVREELDGETLIVFTADHGEMMGNHRLWGKHNCAYEDVWNVPLIVRFPDEYRAERTDVNVSHTDLTATLMSYGKPAEVNGTDVRSQVESGGREYIFSEGGGFFAVSDGARKYVHLHPGDDEYVEFYDMDTDPSEFHNRFADPACHNEVDALQKAAINHFMEDSLAFYQRTPGK